MNRALLAAVFSLVASSAHAEWTFTDVSDEEVTAYKAWTTDFSGDLELQYYCDSLYPDAIDLIVYTGEDFEESTSYAEDGVMRVTIDGGSGLEVTGFFDNHDGELLVYTSSLEVDGVDRVVKAMAFAKDRIDISYYERSFSFPAAGSYDVLAKMVSDCP
ncbi:MAG: hypothetical protein KIT02_04330 [Devosia sp.]|uniref:hypothetical protein n=1 Tax=Devosia sp. TaxID=1871048 RepID=UPI0024CC2810|nr:hypothetical protein [Devosia sp.]UYO00451.1 MAG: hypothetical protein KIT02_04330 [Devosia sp.]